MAPYNFLELAFPSPPEAGPEQPLASAAELQKVREKVAGMRTRMTLPRLRPEQREALGVVRTAAQLAQAQACLRFLDLRQDIALAARVPAELLRESLDKDQALGQAQEALEPLRAATLRGLVQLEGAITACTDRIDWYVDEQAQDRQVPLEQRDRLAALFGAGGRLRRGREGAATQRQALEARLSRRAARRVGAGTGGAVAALRRERLATAPLPTEAQLRGGREEDER